GSVIGSRCRTRTHDRGTVCRGGINDHRARSLNDGLPDRRPGSCLCGSDPWCADRTGCYCCISGGTETALVNASATKRKTNTAPALSSGEFRFPHFGDCTQEGQPSGQPQFSMASMVAITQVAA